MFRSTHSSPSSSYSSSYTSISQGSYSSMSSPMDIAPTPFSSRGPDASCAFPSWPRRSSFSDFDQEERPTSYLSDEDLLFTDFEDDVSSQGSASPVHSPLGTAPVANEIDLFELQRERAAYQREMMRVLLAEKEQRRRQQQAARKQRRSSSSSSKKAPKTKLSAMTPIAEAE